VTFFSCGHHSTNIDSTILESCIFCFLFLSFLFFSSLFFSYAFFSFHMLFFLFLSSLFFSSPFSVFFSFPLFFFSVSKRKRRLSRVRGRHTGVSGWGRLQWPLEGRWHCVTQITFVYYLKINISDKKGFKITRKKFGK